ncbi:MAG: DDE-type integrase/transposase/recombinase [Deltaproteobacteria bacterium]|nr:DDE-type integrase/transposase/recombinase [Deltaproteobacteria bacterium]
MAKKKRKRSPQQSIKRNGPVPFEVRLRIVQAVMRGSKHADVAIAFGVSLAVVQKFLALFERGGVEALRLRVSGAAAGRKPKATADTSASAVVAARAANPEWGTRRIRDVLARFEGLGVSETSVRRILHEAGLIAEHEEVDRRDKPERRFERAEPNQMWQSDIFTFELRRNQRVYLVGFMDDYSRYLVSWAMAHHQKSSLVIEALERGIAEYGEPREVLTDQGRQYAAWRGTTEFQELLRRHGIAHSKSRPQHPETLGKIERFWKTLWDEFLSKTVFADFADCLRRVELFVQHYNFQRPHQGIDGLVPADRFFRAAPQVRAAIEAQTKANALRLAQEKTAQKPFYLVGRLGDQDLSIAAAGGALRVQVGDAAQTIPMTKEHDDETKVSRAFPKDEATVRDDQADRGALRAAAALAATQLREGSATNEGSLSEEVTHATQAIDDEQHSNETGWASRAAVSQNPTLADGPQGPRRNSATTDASDPVGAVGAHAGDNGDHGARHLAAAVLPARDEGSGRDDARAGTWSERSIESRRGDTDTADRRAGGEGRALGTGEPAPRTTALLREEGLAAGAGGNAGASRAEAGPTLDEHWARTFACLEEGDDDAGGSSFDPDDGWRDRAVTWRRKLAGADAPTDGVADGESAWAQRTVDVPEPTGSATGAAEALRRGPGGDRGSNDDQLRSGEARDRASEHADTRAPGGGGDHRIAATASDGPDSDAGIGEEAEGTRRAAREGEREAEQTAPGGGRHDDGGGRDHPQPARAATGYLEDLVSALEALAAETAEQRRGSGTGTDTNDPAPSAGTPDDKTS